MRSMDVAVGCGRQPIDLSTSTSGQTPFIPRFFIRRLPFPKFVSIRCDSPRFAAVRRASLKGFEPCHSFRRNRIRRFIARTSANSHSPRIRETEAKKGFREGPNGRRRGWRGGRRGDDVTAASTLHGHRLGQMHSIRRLLTYSVPLTYRIRYFKFGTSNAFLSFVEKSYFLKDFF